MARPDVTVVVSVYNTMPYLTRCLDSLVAQSIGRDRLEIVAVDDGSTDGSGAELDRFAARYPQTVKVPAGAFNAMVYDVHTSDGRAGVFWIEAAYPHRIIKWSLPPDVSGQLTGSARLAYWRLNADGNESYLGALGLAPPRARQ